jgi:hypothetical protein
LIQTAFGSEVSIDGLPKEQLVEVFCLVEFPFELEFELEQFDHIISFLASQSCERQHHLHQKCIEKISTNFQLSNELFSKLIYREIESEVFLFHLIKNDKQKNFLLSFINFQQVDFSVFKDFFSKFELNETSFEVWDQLKNFIFNFERPTLFSPQNELILNSRKSDFLSLEDYIFINNFFKNQFQEDLISFLQLTSDSNSQSNEINQLHHNKEKFPEECQIFNHQTKPQCQMLKDQLSIVQSKLQEKIDENNFRTIFKI